METVRAVKTVGWNEIVDFTAEAYAATGIPEEAARKAAIAHVDADLHGTVTHGLKNLRKYVSELLDGKMNPRANIRQVGGGKAAAVFAADNAHGLVAAQVGMEKAIELAREYGVGTAFVRDSNHYGASGYWARMALQENMVGFALTSATASIAPWGGRERLVGNNPPSWAIPGAVVEEGQTLQAGESDPTFLDCALSVVAGNRLDIFRRRNEPIPMGWALDAEGEPTTDPAARLKGGTFAPLGDYKGSGMAIVTGMLTTFLSGGNFDDERYDEKGNVVYGTCSHWFQAYDIKQFVDPKIFVERARGVQSRIRAQRPRRGFERVYAPGELENELAKKYLREGIPLEQYHVDDLSWVAEHTGARAPF